MAQTNAPTAARLALASNIVFPVGSDNAPKSITIWFKLDSGITAGDPGLMGEDSNQHAIYWRRSTDRIARRVAGTLQDQWLPTKNAWKHLTMVGADASNSIRTYNNGAVGPTTSQTQAFFFSHFGRRTVGDSFQGLICEITFWNKRLSTAEATALCPGGAFVDPMDSTFDSYGRIHHWRCGLGDAYPTIYDLVGSNHLTMELVNNSNFVSDHP